MSMHYRPECNSQCKCPECRPALYKKSNLKKENQLLKDQLKFKEKYGDLHIKQCERHMDECIELREEKVLLQREVERYKILLHKETVYRAKDQEENQRLREALEQIKINQNMEAVIYIATKALKRGE